MVVTEHVRSSRRSTRRLVRIGALAGALAAVGTTVVAVVASVAETAIPCAPVRGEGSSSRIVGRWGWLRMRNAPGRGTSGRAREWP